MQESEGLGRIGWVALAILVVGILLVVLFGAGAAIYLGLIGTAAAMVIMVWLCLGVPDAPEEPRPEARKVEPWGGEDYKATKGG